MSILAPTARDSWGDQLRNAGLRVTTGRIAALEYVDTNPHSSAADIHAGLTHEHPSLSLQSVHNITADLTDHGIIRRIDPPDSTSALFETRVADNHHHIQCVSCHRIEDLDCVVGQAPCLSPSHQHGMRLIEAAITFRGICADCEAAPTAAAR